MYPTAPMSYFLKNCHVAAPHPYPWLSYAVMH